MISAIPPKKFAYLLIKLIFFMYLQKKNASVHKNNVINPINIEFTNSIIMLLNLQNVVNPITRASILTDIPKIIHVLSLIRRSLSFSFNPSIIITIPTTLITIPPAILGMIVI